MQFLKDNGLNVIRLGVQWPGYQPSRSFYNSTYLDVIFSIVEKAASYGIYTLLDFHQDVLNENFCGEGIPSWTLLPKNTSSNDENKYLNYTFASV